jgi:quercetin dioxygenase-like cupin family protein
MTRLRIMTASAASTALIATSLFVAPALATPGQGFAPAPIVNGTFGTIHINTAGDKTDKWGLNFKTLDSTDLGADRLTVQPGGFSGWHAHPGPVFVTVTRGSIVWFNGADPLCGSTPYSTGQSFIEKPYGPHNVMNASNSADAEFVAITIKPSGFVGPAFRLDRAKPNNCGF